MPDPIDFGSDERLEWYLLTPQQRWAESERLWVIYLALGGSLDPDPDPQSPFFDPAAFRPAGDAQSCRRVTRRGGD